MIKVTVDDIHGEQKRVQCSLGLLQGEPGDSHIRELFERWRDGNEITSHGMVDVSNENPLNFLFVRHPSIRANRFRGAIGQYPHQVHAINLANEYDDVKTLQQPTLYRLKHCFAGYSREYWRLLVPKKDTIYYAIRYEVFPKRWLA